LRRDESFIGRYPQSATMTIRHGGLTVDWLGYATARVEVADGPTVYTDPGRYGVLTGDWSADSPAAAAAHPPTADYRAQDGDVVVITHDHHYDSDGVRRVAAEDATLVVYEAVDTARIEDGGRAVEAPEALPYEVVRVAHGETVAVDGVTVEAIPAHNRPDGPWGDVRNGEPLHPEGFGCGYVVATDGHRWCWPGDSDALAHHRELDVSLFTPPIGQFTMDRQAAAELAGAIGPELVVPIHYNTFEGLEADSAAFASDVAKRGVPVALDER
jgi:L-ascorbate metabolism protein UlaG (beta-lactamase superfamily)